MTADAALHRSRDDAFDAFARHVNPGKVDFFREVGFDAVMGKREGSWFEDAYDGRRFLNCHCNGGVFNLGHRNPRVIAAVQQALLSLDIGNHHLVSSVRARLAERLAATTGGALPGVVFAVSGGEAIDLALKVARGVTGRPRVLSAQGGYHGHTGLALATGDAQYRDPFGPNLPGFEQIPFDDLDALDRALDGSVAAVILEPIPATLGMPIARDGYLTAVASLCKQRGALFIADEVQTGLGRTGKMWAHQHEGVTPDIIVTGKGLSGGVYPIAATLMSSAIHDFFRERPFIHISTFGGAEPGCMAALAVLDIIEEERFLPRVTAVADAIARGLAGRSFSLRQRGLMMGLAMPVPRGGMFASRMLFDQSIFAVYANNDPAVLQLLPPLTITDDEVAFLIDTLTRVLP